MAMSPTGGSGARFGRGLPLRGEQGSVTIGMRWMISLNGRA